MKNKKYHTVGTVPQSNGKIVEKGITDIPSTQIHDRLLSWLGIGISIKCGGAKLALWSTPPLLVKWCCHASVFQV